MLKNEISSQNYFGTFQSKTEKSLKLATEVRMTYWQKLQKTEIFLLCAPRGTRTPDAHWAADLQSAGIAAIRSTHRLSNLSYFQHISIRTQYNLNKTQKAIGERR